MNSKKTPQKGILAQFLDVIVSTLIVWH